MEEGDGSWMSLSEFKLATNKTLGYDIVTVGPVRTFCRPFSYAAIDLRSVVCRDGDCRFTVCVFVFAVSCRGLVVGAGARISCDQAGACVRARLVLVNQFELRSD